MTRPGLQTPLLSGVDSAFSVCLVKTSHPFASADGTRFHFLEGVPRGKRVMEADYSGPKELQAGPRGFLTVLDVRTEAMAREAERRGRIRCKKLERLCGVYAGLRVSSCSSGRTHQEAELSTLGTKPARRGRDSDTLYLLPRFFQITKKRREWWFVVLFRMEGWRLYGCARLSQNCRSKI